MVKAIPMAALTGVMFMVSFGTFDWGSLWTLNKIPRSDAVVMVLTVAVVVATSNLALGVLCGVILSAVSFGWKMARISVSETTGAKGEKVYTVKGQLFFGTMSHFIDLFDYRGDPDKVIIDFSASHVWDNSATNAITKAVDKYDSLGKQVSITGIHPDNRKMIERAGMASTFFK